MRGLSIVLVASIATICVLHTSSAQEIAEKSAAMARLGNFEQTFDRMQPTEEHLRRFGSAARRADIQPFDFPTECKVEWYVEPRQAVLPGQVLGRVVPRRGRMIAPRFRPGAMILDETDGKLQRD